MSILSMQYGKGKARKGRLTANSAFSSLQESSGALEPTGVTHFFSPTVDSVDALLASIIDDDSVGDTITF